MAEKRALQGAFGSLSDTLLFRFDPSAPEEVREAWLGTVALHASVARRFSDWVALARACDAYDPVIARLDAATGAIVAADDERETLAALTEARAAIGDVGVLLDTDPCGARTA